MTAFALKGLLGRKLRTALTALAIVLGVAMVSGTYVLTDSISSAFDAIFTEIYKGTDAVDHRQVARSTSASDQAARLAVVRRVAARRGQAAARTSTAAIGGVGGEAQLIGENGKAIVFGGAPNIGFSVDPTHAASSTRSRSSKARWPRPARSSIDKRRPRKKDLDVGQTIGVQAEGRSSSCGSPGSSSSARSTRSAARRSRASTCRPRSSSSTRRDARPDPCRGEARRLAGRSSLAEIQAILPPERRSGPARRRRRGREGHERLPQFLQTSCSPSAASRSSSAPS